MVCPPCWMEPEPSNANYSGTNDTAADYQAAFVTASDTWERSDNSFDATYLGPTTRKASSFGNGPSFMRMDNNNDVDFGNLNKYSGAIAVVLYWYYSSTGEIVEADMRMNEDYPWTANVGFNGNPDTSTGNTCCYEYNNIGIHEFGHFHSGLNDLYDVDESKLTMYGYGAKGELKNRTLGLGDVISIASAYPATTPPPLAVTTTSLPDGAVDAAYSATLEATGGAAPYTWAITVGAISAGLSLNTSTGEISGTPTTAETQNFTVEVTDDDLATDTQALSIIVNPPPPLAVTTTSLPDGTVGVAYSTMLEATGGTAPYTWAITVGAIPAGLSLNTSTGEISGTPTTAETQNFTVEVTDGDLATDTQALSISINLAPSGTFSLTVSYSFLNI